MASKSDSVFQGGNIQGGLRTGRADKPGSFSLRTQTLGMLQPENLVTQKVVGSPGKNAAGIIATQLSHDIAGYLHDKAEDFRKVKVNNELTNRQLDSQVFTQNYLSKVKSGLGLTDGVLKDFDSKLEEGIKDFSDDEKDQIRVRASGLRKSIGIAAAVQEKNTLEEFNALTVKASNVSLLDSVSENPENAPALKPIYDSNTDIAKGSMSAVSFDKLKLESKKVWMLTLGEALIRRNPTNWESVLKREDFKGVSHDTYDHLLKYGTQQKEKLENKAYRDEQRAYIQRKLDDSTAAIRMQRAIGKDPSAFTDEQIIAAGLLPKITEGLLLYRDQKIQAHQEEFNAYKAMNSNIEKGIPQPENIKDKYQNDHYEEQLKNLSEKEPLTLENAAQAAINGRYSSHLKSLSSSITTKLTSKDPKEVVEGAEILLKLKNENPSVIKSTADKYSDFSLYLTQNIIGTESNAAQVIQEAESVFLAPFSEKQQADRMRLYQNYKAGMSQKFSGIPNWNISGHMVNQLMNQDTDWKINPSDENAHGVISVYPKKAFEEKNKRMFYRRRELHPAYAAQLKIDANNALKEAFLAGFTGTGAEEKAKEKLKEMYTFTLDNQEPMFMRNHPHSVYPELKQTPLFVPNMLASRLTNVVNTSLKDKNYHGIQLKFKDPLIIQKKGASPYNENLTSGKRIISAKFNKEWQDYFVYYEADLYTRGIYHFYILPEPKNWAFKHRIGEPFGFK